MASVSRLASPGLLVGVAAGFMVGAVTALLGTATHLTDVRVPPAVGGFEVPSGLLLAVALVLAADTALAAATLRPAVLVAVGVGRAFALVPFLLPDPGGDVVLTGELASTVWVLVAILVPVFMAPPLSGPTRRRRKAVAT